MDIAEIDKLPLAEKFSKRVILKVSKIEKECGLAQGSIGHWDEVKPSYDKVVSVASYLEMTVEELLQN